MIKSPLLFTFFVLLAFFIPAAGQNPSPQRTAEFYFNQAEEYQRAGKLAEAVESFKQAIRLEPSMYAAYADMGIVYGQLGKHEESVNALKQAVQLKSDMAELHYNLGIAYAAWGRFDDAVKSFKTAINLKPGLWLAHNALGLAYQDLKNY
jgi:tetratricopeptide (TPR) repeat protein